MPIFPVIVSNSGGNKPGTPTGITLTNAGSSSLNASWTAPVYTGKHPLSSYIISLYSSSGVLINASYATVSHPSTSTTITGLSSSTTYSIRVTLRNSINVDSDLSLASANATTSAPPPPPPPPPPPCVPNFGNDCFGPQGQVGQIDCNGNCVFATPPPPPPPPGPLFSPGGPFFPI
jgi:hypothetical protein